MPNDREWGSRGRFTSGTDRSYHRSSVRNIDDESAFRRSTASGFGGNSDDDRHGGRNRRSSSRFRDFSDDDNDRRNSNHFEEGDKIEACFGGGQKYFKGIITRRRADNTYDIRYDDGDSERRVRPKLIRKLSSRYNSRDATSGDEAGGRNRKWHEGDKVKARYNGSKAFFTGTITRIRYDDTFDIRYADGDTASRVPRSHIQSIDYSTSPHRKHNGWKSSSSDDSNKQGEISRGDRIQADYKVNSSSDSDSGGEMVTDDDAEIEEGDKIEARYGGKSKFYKGKVVGTHSDGTFDILYEDGDKEKRVKRKYIKKKTSKKKKKTKSKANSSSDSDSGGEMVTDDDAEIEEGDKIEARYGGKSKFYKGKVVGTHSDGTFDILYEDGDKEKRVKRKYIKKKTSKKKKKTKSKANSSSDSDSGGEMVTDDDAE
eukprot:GSMAST32.ASY1.ANO1.760.1 assembled CDS